MFKQIALDQIRAHGALGNHSVELFSVHKAMDMNVFGLGEAEDYQRIPSGRHETLHVLHDLSGRAGQGRSQPLEERLMLKPGCWDTISQWPKTSTFRGRTLKGALSYIKENVGECFRGLQLQRSRSILDRSQKTAVCISPLDPKLSEK